MQTDTCQASQGAEPAQPSHPALVFRTLPGRGEPATGAGGQISRLQAINARLEQLGASEEFCRSYFHSGAGICEEEFGGVCVEHRPTPFALPPGLMCARKYGRKLQYLRKRIELVEAERKTLKEQWTSFKIQQESVENMLANNEEGQTLVRERRACFQHQISHKLGELRKLQGDLYRLLSGVKPIDAARFHEEITSCLLTKMSLLEELVLGTGGSRARSAGAAGK